MRRFVSRVVEAVALSGRVPKGAARSVLKSSAATARLLSRFGDEAARSELVNLLEAVGYFSSSQFDASGQGSDDFGGQRNRGREIALGPPCYEGLWALEGLGYWHAKSLLRASRDRVAIFSAFERLPASKRGIFQVGATIALAEHMFRNSQEPPTDAYLRLCEENRPAELKGVETDTLGFVITTLFPSALEQAARVTAADHRLDAFLWHGVGRALYLKYPPALGAPGGSWPALLDTLPASISVDRRQIALAGFGWAVGLVNLRDPQLIQRSLEAFAAENQDLANFRSGLAEALRAWLRWRNVGGGLSDEQVDVRSSLARDLLSDSPANIGCFSPGDRSYGEMLTPGPLSPER